MVRIATFATIKVVQLLIEPAVDPGRYKVRSTAWFARLVMRPKSLCGCSIMQLAVVNPQHTLQHAMFASNFRTQSAVEKFTHSRRRKLSYSLLSRSSLGRVHYHHL